jgi:methionyl-tRNA formyltransferase
VPHRIIFFGSPEFAVPSLRALNQDPRFEIALVVTQPDRPAGRGRRVVESPVKSTAEELNIPVWQPNTLRSDDAIERLSDVRPDVHVVVAYGEIFRRVVLTIPPHGSLNVHPSLLPKYRGSSPIPAAILNGDDKSGVSIIEMVRRLDAGPIVAQRDVDLSGRETGGSLARELATLSGEMLPDVVDRWIKGEIVSVPQNDALATFTRELTKADGRIDWMLSAIQIERQVRAYSPWPAAWTTVGNRRLVIHQAEVIDCELELEPGSIVRDERDVVVACGSGVLRLIDVRPEGKKSMPADAWLRGIRDQTVPRFGLTDREMGE